jgi:hypothetical protein
MALRRIDSLTEYAQYLRQNREELEALYYIGKKILFLNAFHIQRTWGHRRIWSSDGIIFAYKSE